MVLLQETVLGNIDIRRGGWLHRLVQYHKGKFINELRQLSPFQIKATIIPAPEGYKDSKDWNFDNVLHLIVLLRGSESSAPVYRAVRRMMAPSRRIMMSMKDSFKHFPSLSHLPLNEMYYDIGSAEDYEDDPTPVESGSTDEDGVIVVSNPVEARLPSSQISVKLLKEILVQRALAGRVMPSTTRFTIPWTPMNKTSTEASNIATSEGDNAEVTTAGTGEATNDTASNNDGNPEGKGTEEGNEEDGKKGEEAGEKEGTEKEETEQTESP